MDMPPYEAQDPEIIAFWLRFGRWTVAALQVTGGLFGLYAVMFGTLLSPSRFLFLLTFLLFGASVYGGVMLALDKRSGIIVSLLIQALQLVQVAVEGLIYSFLCGFQLVVGSRPVEDGPQVGFSYWLPVRFIISINPTSPTVQGIGMTGVNVVAVLAIICLLFVRASHRRPLLPKPHFKPPTKDVWPPAPAA